jgi:hypothetical protein
MVQVETFDGDRHTEHRRLERHRQVLIDHREPAPDLLDVLDGLNRTKKLPTSVPTTPPQSTKVSCAAGRARPGGELLGNCHCQTMSAVTAACFNTGQGAQS